MAAREANVRNHSAQEYNTKGEGNVRNSHSSYEDKEAKTGTRLRRAEVDALLDNEVAAFRRKLELLALADAQPAADSITANSDGQRDTTRQARGTMLSAPADTGPTPQLAMPTGEVKLEVLTPGLTKGAIMNRIAVAKNSGLALSYHSEFTTMQLTTNKSVRSWVCYARISKTESEYVDSECDGSSKSIAEERCCRELIRRPTFRQWLVGVELNPGPWYNEWVTVAAPSNPNSISSSAASSSVAEPVSLTASASQVLAANLTSQSPAVSVGSAVTTSEMSAGLSVRNLSGGLSCCYAMASTVSNPNVTATTTGASIDSAEGVLLGGLSEWSFNGVGSGSGAMVSKRVPAGTYYPVMVSVANAGTNAVNSLATSTWTWSTEPAMSVLVANSTPISVSGTVTALVDGSVSAVISNTAPVQVAGSVSATITSPVLATVSSGSVPVWVSQHDPGVGPGGATRLVGIEPNPGPTGAELRSGSGCAVSSSALSCSSLDSLTSFSSSSLASHLCSLATGSAVSSGSQHGSIWSRFDEVDAKEAEDEKQTAQAARLLKTNLSGRPAVTGTGRGVEEKKKDRRPGAASNGLDILDVSEVEGAVIAVTQHDKNLHRYVLDCLLTPDDNYWVKGGLAEEEETGYLWTPEKSESVKASYKKGVRPSDAMKIRKQHAAQRAQTTKVLTAEEKAEMKEAVLKRVAAKVKNAGDLCEYMRNRHPDIRFMRALVEKVLGSTWYYKPATADVFYLHAKLNKLKAGAELSGYALFEPKLLTILGSQGGKQWLKELEKRHSSLEFRAVKERLVCVELNPGPFFPASMSQIKGSDSFMKLYDVSDVTKGIEPEVVQLAVNTMPASTNVSEFDMASQQVLNGDAIDENNNYVTGLSVAPPYSFSRPRLMRGDEDGKVTESPYTDQAVFGTALLMKGEDLIGNALSESLAKMQVETGGNMGRREAVFKNGTSQRDLMYFSGQTATLGFDPTLPTLKWGLLMVAARWADSPNQLPTGAEFSKYDSACRMKRSVAVRVEWNTSPVFNEECLDDQGDFVLPAYGGEKGSVRFYNAATACDDNRRSTMYAPHLAHEQMGSISGLGTAMSVFIERAPAPLGLAVLNVRTTNIAGTDEDEQLFAPFGSRVFLPGDLDIRVKLARNGPSADPTDAKTATLTTLVNPCFGPVPVGTHAAFEPIQVNWVGSNDAYSVSLAEYFLSWAPLLTVPNLIMWMQYRNGSYPMYKMLKYVWELTAMLAVRFPTMPIAQTGVVPRRFLIADATQQITVDAYCMRCRSLVDYGGVGAPQTYPLQSIPKSDFVVPMCDVIALTQINLGLRTVAGGAGPDPSEGLGGRIPKLWSSPYMLNLLGITALQMGAVFQTHLHIQAWPVSTWKQMYTDEKLSTIRTYQRGHFVTFASTDQRIQAPLWSRRLRRLFANMTGTSLATGLCGLTVYDIHCAPFAPDFNSVNWTLNDVGDEPVEVSGICPTFLPDVWVNMAIKKTCVHMTSYPPGYTQESLCGITGSDFALARLAGYRGTAYHGSTPKPAIGNEDTRDDDDAERFNARFFMVKMSLVDKKVSYALRTLSGSGPGAGEPEIGSCPIMRSTAEDDTGGFVQAQAVMLLTANTTWLPSTDADGLYVFPSAAYEHMSQMSSYLFGLSKAVVPIWSLTGLVNVDSVISQPSGAGKSIWMAGLLEAEGVVAASGLSLPATTPSAASLKAAPKNQ